MYGNGGRAMKAVFNDHMNSDILIDYWMLNIEPKNENNSSNTNIIFVKILLRPYDVTTHSNMPFVHSFMQFHLKCVLDVILHS